MRRIKLPDVAFSHMTPEVDTNGKPIIQLNSAAKELGDCVAVPAEGQSSFSLDDIERRLPLLRKLRKADENKSRTLLLEDSEYDLLMEIFAPLRWVAVTDTPLLVRDALANAEVVDIEAVTSPDPPAA